MRIRVCSVMVDDQEKALQFYTNILGFVKKQDIPMGEHRWLTVVSPESDEVELVMEPLGFEPAKLFQKALFDAGIPWTMFHVDDVHKEYERLQALGVEFFMPPTSFGAALLTIFNDTCGNKIQLVQV